jgi:hypothetical protein
MPEIELFLSPQELEALQPLVLQRKEESVQSLVRRIVRGKWTPQSKPIPDCTWRYWRKSIFLPRASPKGMRVSSCSGS